MAQRQRSLARRVQERTSLNATTGSTSSPPRPTHTGFDFVVDVKGQVVRLTVAPEDLIFDRPGKIWFEGDVGPFSVPPKASDLARPGWSAFVTAAKAAGRWHLLEVGAVYP